MSATERLTAALADRYRILRELGQGGMATVYLAEDLKHDRKVAVKVLKPELAAVLGAERFVVEIKTTAALSHPHILPLFDSGTADGFLFYVMPFVDGETLRDRLNRETQLGVDEAVRITTEVADALEYAHSHGVIHRDIKPENILLQGGRPMVADFGIALAVSAAAGGRMTETGLSLGTPHYMSPEQATAEKEITGRSDVYSLASVCYEMLAGEPPHMGNSAQQIIMKIITDRARPVSELRQSVPPHVAAALGKALEKLPADRFASAQAFADALSGRTLAAVPTAYHTAPSPRGRAARAWLPWGVAAAALLVAALAVLGGGGRVITDEMVARYELAPPEQGRWMPSTLRLVAVAPGARFVAYTAFGEDSVSRIYLREAGDVIPREVPGSERGEAPFFSPDGAWLAFWSSGQIKKMPVTGGRAVTVADVPPTAATWSPSGWILATGREGVFRVSANGGVFERIVALDSISAFYPVALDDGESVLFGAYGMGGAPAARIGVFSLKSAKVTILDVAGAAPLGVVDGTLVYASATGVVMAVPFDVAKHRVTGAPITLTDQIVVDASVGAAHASLTSAGDLVYLSGVARRQMVLVGADGSVQRVGEPGPYVWPRFSPDGRRIAVAVGSQAQRHVSVYDLPSGPFVQITNRGTINDRPEWTPDGRSVLFRSDRLGRNGIFVQALDQTSEAELLYADSTAQIDEGVMSPDGRTLLVQRDATGDGELWTVSLDGGASTAMGSRQRSGAQQLDAQLGLFAARYSPDGRWIAFGGGGSGSFQTVRVRPSDRGGVFVRISGDGGTTPVWAADGKSITFVENGVLRRVMVTSTSPFRVSAPRTVLSGPYTFNTVHADFDLSPDGRYILALRASDQAARMVMVRNLGAELRERFAGAPR